MTTPAKSQPSRPMTRPDDMRRFGARTNSVRGIGIATPYILDCARYLEPADAFAVKWLCGYARLLDCPADAFAESLALEPRQIRELLTSPQPSPEMRARFTGAVQLLADEWHARLDAPYTAERNPFPYQTPWHQALGKLAKTRVSTEVRKAVKFAEAGGWAVVQGLERMGKTVDAAGQFLRRLDRAAWLRVPSGDSKRDFLDSLARACGVPNGDNGTIGRVRAPLAEVLVPGKIETIFLDQFHAILPINAHRAFPQRLELAMDLLDEHGVNFVGIATPQWGNQMEALAANGRYREGQATGRMRLFELEDALTPAELTAIAASRAPELTKSQCENLATHAAKDRGYCGTLMATLARYRLLRAGNRPATITEADWQNSAVATAIHEREPAKKGGK